MELSFMNINLEYYKFFYYAAKCGSITQAAEALSVTQPAVSQAIRALAKALGTELFVRNGKGVQLTPAGEVLYDYVKRGYEQIDHRNLSGRRWQNSVSGKKYHKNRAT